MLLFLLNKSFHHFLLVISSNMLELTTENFKLLGELFSGDFSEELCSGGYISCYRGSNHEKTGKSKYTFI